MCASHAMAIPAAPPPLHDSEGFDASADPARAPDVVRALRDDGSLDPAHDPKVKDELVLALHRQMVLVRLVDTRLAALQREGRVAFHIGASGEEAAIVGSAAALRANDWIFPSGREIGAALWRGLSLGSYLHHVFGSVEDASKGRQTPEHFASKKAKVAPVGDLTGTHIPHGVGFAWAAKSRREDVVALVYFGEGATSSGDFHNGVNMAGVFKVPVVFFCRNNGWATSTPASKQTACATFAGKGVAYGVPGVRVDGSDLFAVLAVTRAAVERAASGGGPTLIEAILLREHAATPATAANAANGTKTARTDPLARTRAWLDKKGLFSDAMHATLVEKLEREIDVAIAAAEGAAPPSRESLFDDVYARANASGEIALPWHLREQRARLVATPARALPTPRDGTHGKPATPQTSEE
jgi:pyruvate dehydrogenase E1 component alpha subunit